MDCAESDSLADSFLRSLAPLRGCPTFHLEGWDSTVVSPVGFSTSANASVPTMDGSFFPAQVKAG